MSELIATAGFYEEQLGYPRSAFFWPTDNGQIIDRAPDGVIDCEQLRGPIRAPRQLWIHSILKQLVVVVADFAPALTTNTSIITQPLRVSKRSPHGDSVGAMITSRGRYVIFESTASNLTEVDRNSTNDVFIRALR